MVLQPHKSRSIRIFVEQALIYEALEPNLGRTALIVGVQKEAIAILFKTEANSELQVRENSAKDQRCSLVVFRFFASLNKISLIITMSSGSMSLPYR